MSLILPGPQPPTGRLQIIVPHGLEDRPIGGCDLCEIPFWSDRDRDFHLRSYEHREAVQAALAEREAHKQRLAIFYTDPDPEVSAHLREVGKRMRAEGRWTVKKSERAGFS